ncbi:MAG: DUF1566 domain-containing protein [Desulfovermiculus sp.]|nr:DUF1566 domain-containing protein [Desulfovermiculus sp.]
MFSNFPDTGQEVCYNNTEEISCPSSGEPFYGQDPQFTRLPRSYTKLGGQSGEELPNQASPAHDGGRWLMTRDNVTGLTWEVKTPDNQNKLYPYTSLLETNIYDYVRKLNRDNYGGYSDWRIPSIKELSSLVNSSLSDPVVEDKWFPNTSSLKYWSINYYMGSHDDFHNEYTYAWILNMGSGEAAPQKKSVKSAFMAVRGGAADDDPGLVDNNDGTVTDPSTGLMWMKCSLGQTWDDDNSACQGDSVRHTWQDTLNVIQNLQWAGYSDWRLPNRNELQSLVDYSKFDPAVDSLLKENTPSSYHWTSTTVAGKADRSWHLDLSTGSLDIRTKSINWDARAVRGGHSKADLVTHNDSNDLFARLEALFPEILTPALQNTIKNEGLLYRCYPDTNVCTGTFADDLYYLDEQGTLHNLGSAEYWLNTLESFIGWAVGTSRGQTANPVILHTDNRGQTWSVQDIPQGLEEKSLNDIAVLDSRNVWVVGGGSDESLILRTTDGGLNWIEINSLSESDIKAELLGISAVDKHTVWAVGANSLIISTTDGGETWKRHDSGIQGATFEEVGTFQGKYIWVVGAREQGKTPVMARSTDGGQTWEQISSQALDSADHLIGISVFDRENVWVTGGNYHVLKSDDSGQTWTTLYQGPFYDANNVSIVSPEKAWAVMDQGGVYSFTQGGSLYEQQEVPGEAHGYHLLSISPINENEAWVFGTSWSAEGQGIILHTTDGGNNWLKQEMPIDTGVQSGAFVNAFR